MPTGNPEVGDKWFMASRHRNEILDTVITKVTGKEILCSHFDENAQISHSHRCSGKITDIRIFPTFHEAWVCKRVMIGQEIDKAQEILDNVKSKFDKFELWCDTRKTI